MLAGTSSQALLQIAVLVVLARLLTPDEFGLAAAGLVVTNFFMIFTVLGIGPALVQHQATTEKHIRSGFTITVLAAAGCSALVWNLAPIISNLFRMPPLVPIIRALALVFLARGGGVVAEFLLRRDLQFRRIAFVTAFSYLFAFGGVGILMAFQGFGVWALVTAQICQAALSSIIFLALRPHSVKPLLDLSAIAVLMRFGAGHSLATVIGNTAGQVDKLVIGRWLGPEMLGVYERSYQLMTNASKLFGSSLNGVLFPVMAQLQDQPERLGRAYVRATGTAALLILPASCVAFVLAPEIVAVLLGSQWAAAVTPYRILALALLFHTSTQIGAALAGAMNAVYHKLARQLLLLVMIGAGAWYGMRWGMAGIATAVVLARSIDYFATGALCLRLTRQRWADYLSTHVPALGLSLVTGVVSYVTAYLLRGLDVTAILVLGGSGLTTVATVVLLTRIVPPRVAGQSAQWAMTLVSSYAAAHRSRLRSPVPADGAK